MSLATVLDLEHEVDVPPVTVRIVIAVSINEDGIQVDEEMPLSDTIEKEEVETEIDLTLIDILVTSDYPSLQVCNLQTCE